MKLVYIPLALACLSLANCSDKSTDKNTKTEAKAKPTSDGSCTLAGPQTPRDIASKAGTNTLDFPLAQDASALNLCNIHTHTQAEHKGPGFSFFAGDGVNGGYQCNETDTLSEAELSDPLAAKTAGGSRPFKGVKPGDTIEVHWAHSSCDVSPGAGLGSCLAEGCNDPLLRVEAQVFLLVNDPDALDFNDFTFGNTQRNGRYQAKALPNNTGTPVVFRGSTTGPSYTNEVCSPYKVTWSVRPNCAKLDINSLYRWASEGNVFEETKTHGVRALVTDPALLSPIP